MNALKTHWLGIALLIAALFFGLFSYKNYGIAWDEDDQRELGRQNYRFVFEGDQSLWGFINRDYGPAVELPLHLLERWSGQTDSRDIFQFRHLCLHLFFLAGMVAAYFLLFGMYRNGLLAATGVLLLLTATHLYAHSFFNSKDIPFLVLNVFNFYGAFRFFSKPTIWRSILLGATMGLTINLRVLGLVPFGLLLFFMAADAFRNRKSTVELLKRSAQTVLFAASTLGVLIGSWPLLWHKPFVQFAEVCRNMSNFRWVFWCFFNGKLINSDVLPWNYVPTWMAITTPVTHLLIGLFGLLFFRYSHWHDGKSVFSDLKTRMNFLFLAGFGCPLLMVWMLDPVLLDGWRHLFFIYPPFIFLGVFGLEKLFADRRLKIPAMAVVVFGVSSAAFFMVKNAPFQHLYFNVLINRGEPEKIRHSFEMDFWGLGYRQALERVLAADSRPKITIAVESYPGRSNLQILKKADRDRVECIKKEDAAQADYFITNYRMHPDDYPEFEAFKWHSLKVDNNSFVTTYKLK